MAAARLARDQLWELAAGQHGYFTAQQARDLGITRGALNQLAHRGTVARAAFGVYRFPRFPVEDVDRYMLAVLWTRAPEAALSHETALDVYDVCDVNPGVIHVTVGTRRRLRRADGTPYEIHHQDLEPAQVAWWNEVPTVTLEAAIAQCIESGTPTYLLRQSIKAGNEFGRLTRASAAELSAQLEARNTSNRVTGAM